jgi:flagellar basal body-associated protein FliL
MTQEELKRRAIRKTLTIVVLVLVVLAIYIGSFFVVTG